MSHLCSEWNQAMSSQSHSGCSGPNNWLRGSSESWSDFTSLLEPIRDNRADSFAQLCHARFTGSIKTGSTSEGKDQYIGLFICDGSRIISFRKTCQSKCG